MPKTSPVVFEGIDRSLDIYGQKIAIRSILLVKVDHVGDFALALDAFMLLRRTFHNAKITLVCGPWNAEMARGAGLFDETIVVHFFPARADAPLVTFTPDMLGELRGRTFDLAVDLRVDPDTRVILDHIEARITCGYDSAMSRRPLTVSVPTPNLNRAADLGMHQSLMLLRLAHTVTQFLNPSEPVGVHMIQALSHEPSIDLSFLSGKVFVILNTSSGRAAKNWPLERFKRLAHWLCRDMNAGILLVGTKDQVSDAEEIIVFCNSPHVGSVVGRTSLAQALGLIRQSDIFIGNDSGLTHFAARMDVPTVAIYSGIDPTEIWAPRGANVTVIKAPVACSPCHILNLRDCRFGHACISAISLPFVRAVVRNALLKISNRARDENVEMVDNPEFGRTVV